MFNAVHANLNLHYSYVKKNKQTKNLALSLALHAEGVYSVDLTAASKVFTQLQLVVVGMSLMVYL